MNEDLDYLKYLDSLGRIASGRIDGLDTSALERDFLQFSSYHAKRSLIVVQPKLYKLTGEQPERLREALDSLGIKVKETPTEIDMGGMFDYKSNPDLLVLLSMGQLEADHLIRNRAGLQPILEKVFIDGFRLLNDFSLHEPLLGKVSYRRDGLDLKEVAIFPEKFKPGSYDLEVTLDTPGKTVRNFMDFARDIKGSEKNPKAFVLDPKKVDSMTTRGLALRGILGALSRYNVPESNTFSARTNFCTVRDGRNKLFYLYSESQRKNVVVYFGEPNLPEEQLRGSLIVLNGDDNQKTLSKLVELGIFRPSQSVTQKRIEDLVSMYDDARRGSATTLKDEHIDFKRLLTDLKEIESCLDRNKDPILRTAYVLGKAPELLEFVVCPTTDNPMVHELLPRISWNTSIRRYHNSEKFMSEFEIGDEADKIRMLNEVVGHIPLANYQNNDVNLWLYQNHQELCKKAGIDFSVS